MYAIDLNKRFPLWSSLNSFLWIFLTCLFQVLVFGFFPPSLLFLSLFLHQTHHAGVFFLSVLLIKALTQYFASSHLAWLHSEEFHCSFGSDQWSFIIFCNQGSCPMGCRSVTRRRNTVKAQKPQRGRGRNILFGFVWTFLQQALRLSLNMKMCSCIVLPD